MVAVNTDFLLRDKGFSNALNINEFPRHRWYFVKEGFSPKIVEMAIQTDGIQPGEVIMDPFSGSGTVPLTGALFGLRARGFEINPFLRFISSTKLCQVPSDKFYATAHQLLLALKKPIPSPFEGYSTFTKGNAWNRWLFPRSVLRRYESGRRELANIDLPLRDLLQMALIGAVMDCCNATRDGKCLRYIKDWRENEANGSVFRKYFKMRAKVIAKDLKSTPVNIEQSFIKEGDARKLISLPSLEKFHICVTSPPYLNSFDYSDIYRPELFLGGFVDSNESLMNLRLQTVRSHVQASWEKPEKDNFGILYKDCIGKIRENTTDLWNRRIPTMIQAYFEDMETIFRGLRLWAHDNASMWLVVSTSAYAGVEVPVDLILAEIGQRVGWFLREIVVLRYLRSSSQHYNREENRSVPLRESVVILDASKRRSK